MATTLNASTTSSPNCGAARVGSALRVHNRFRRRVVADLLGTQNRQPAQHVSDGNCHQPGERPDTDVLSLLVRHVTEPAYESCGAFTFYPNKFGAVTPEAAGDR